MHDARRRPRDMARLGNQREESRKRDRVTGLHNVVYKLQSHHKMQVDGISAEVYNVFLHCDVARTPWCEKPKTKKAPSG